jgi:hypothetical protein
MSTSNSVGRLTATQENDPSAATPKKDRPVCLLSPLPLRQEPNSPSLSQPGPLQEPNHLEPTLVRNVR